MSDETGSAQAAMPATLPPGLLGRAAATGLVAAGGATAFVVVEHETTDLLWEHLPERLGFDEVPWWWATGLLVIGALLTAAALRLPGGGGHTPRDGLSFDVGPRTAVSVVAAAFATLVFGAVLGPEAPALAIGTATGAVLAAVGRPRRPDAEDGHRRLLMLAGGMAAFGAVLGNPLAIAIFVLEAALVARRTAGAPLTLAPTAVALAAGYLLQVGIGPWVGFGEVVLALPELEPYPTVRGVDLLLVVPLAVAIAGLVHLGFRLAGSMAQVGARRPPVVMLLVAAVLTAALALAARALVDAPLDRVLFSGQSALPSVVTATSAGALMVVALAKLAAYTLALGSGFRGGPVFPLIYVCAAFGTSIALLVEASSTAGLVAGAVAAGTAAVIRLPFASALLAVLLTSGAGLAVTSPALLGSVVALLTVLALDRRRGPRVVGPTEQS